MERGAIRVILARAKEMKTGKQNQGSSRNGFIIALLCSVALAFLFPSPGAKGGWMHPELLNNAGVALILFVQGLAIAVERMKAGASNWRLHLIVQSFTFLLFPIVGLAFHKMTRVVWPSEPSALRDGFLYLCVLPSTVSTSVVLTTVARVTRSALSLMRRFPTFWESCLPRYSCAC